jgi:hypothetical protein
LEAKPDRERNDMCLFPNSVIETNKRRGTRKGPVVKIVIILARVPIFGNPILGLPLAGISSFEMH